VRPKSHRVSTRSSPIRLAETKTSTEKAFLQGFVNQVGNIKAIIVSILAAVLFTLFLLVLANTMAQSVASGPASWPPQDARVLEQPRPRWCSPSRSSSHCWEGGLGLAVTYFAVQGGSFNNSFLPVFIMRNRDIVIGWPSVARWVWLPEHGLRPPRCGCASPMR